MSTMTTQTLSSRLSTAIQTDTHAEDTTQQAHPATTHTAYLSPHRAPGVSVAQVPVSATAVTSQARQNYMSVSDTRVTQAPVSSEDRPSTVQAFMAGTSSATVSSANNRSAYQSQSDYHVTGSQARNMPPPPVYTTRSQATLASQQPRLGKVWLKLKQYVTQYSTKLFYVIASQNLFHQNYAVIISIFISCMLLLEYHQLALTWRCLPVSHC